MEMLVETTRFGAVELVEEIKTGNMFALKAVTSFCCTVMEDSYSGC